ncbi:galactose mutarotase [Protopterus annectens]|uniref:galactose mutarotase n=1 Tax=Protopterus annectens TaxID=7888 RepID=UPI001CFA5D02|nr:galactose mutarotase [Protopterus annectens]XP_043913429.1 galactose mutarotase [Protopterus annectens]XP_043913437.1 galactose mutarotase [Protopterus annectens]
MTEVTKETFGTLPDGGGVVDKFILKSDSVTVEIISFGCIVTTLQTKDRHGKVADIVLGFDNLEGYIKKHPYFGAVVGRVANRISSGKFSIDGQEYQLAINKEPNSIHGGIKGFDKALWTPEVLPNGVRFALVSPDKDEGFPGELKVWVTYTLAEGELTIDYRAKTSKTTPVNLTNHSYFNLAGHGAPNIYDHEVCITAESYLPADDVQIPTGEIASVQNTYFDLRKAVKLGSHMQQFHMNGFDHNFCLPIGKDKKHCARVYHPATGRVLDVCTTQPGVQFYTMNAVTEPIKGKNGATYCKHSAFCLETQNWPDAVNKLNFPDSLLRPGEEYQHTTWLKFSAA